MARYIELTNKVKSICAQYYVKQCDICPLCSVCIGHRYILTVENHNKYTEKLNAFAETIEKGEITE